MRFGSILARLAYYVNAEFEKELTSESEEAPDIRVQNTERNVILYIDEALVLDQRELECDVRPKFGVYFVGLRQILVDIATCIMKEISGNISIAYSDTHSAISNFTSGSHPYVLRSYGKYYDLHEKKKLLIAYGDAGRAHMGRNRAFKQGSYSSSVNVSDFLPLKATIASSNRLRSRPVSLRSLEELHVFLTREFRKCLPKITGRPVFMVDSKWYVIRPLPILSSSQKFSIDSLKERDTRIQDIM
ncbi:hypothetical protein ADUPG1_011652 [Aduncisulcus paluster]|uniref:Uncharacterized protein n=1 Tax=Aduncisulcus paluster TaxID=2918883 RepID=A0ABQ5JWL0_9EUKA|nr:hypothetical protein ADUPG1_011652 [Aduncisulcus paluster]